MRSVVTVFFLLGATTLFGQTRYEKDFLAFWTDVNEHYAYLHQQKLDWEKAKEIYGQQVKLISNNKEFIRFLESLLNEFYNGHVSLNVNLSSSNRLIPSGQDLFVQQTNHKFVVTDIRKGWRAELAGIRIGDEITSFNGQPIATQLQQFLPKTVTTYSPAMYQYAINMLLAGTHDKKRTIEVIRDGQSFTFSPDSIHINTSASLIEKRILNNNTAVIKINNSLGNFQTIAAFDEALDSLMHCKNLVIDLTETPGGGNSTVARGIMGRFISTPQPYQQHEFDETAFQTLRRWVEFVTPRKTRFKGRVYVLVGHWTGSMGEGIAIGFDGMKRATIIGTEMAKLIGAIQSFLLPETNISFQIPTERLYHINGTAREDYKPAILTRNIEETLKKLDAIR